MKKFTSMLLVLVLSLGLVSMTGCGGSGDEELANAYAELDLSEYITLPDYDAFTAGEPEVTEITEEDVDAQIADILEQAATQEEVKDGTVEEGDYLVIDFAGTLEDGSTVDGMNAEDYELGPIGNAGFIDGFEDGLIGAAVGETVSLDLQFPDPYSVNTDLSGKPVTFEVTIKSKLVEVVPELNDEFVKENSDVKTVAEYRAYVKEQMELADYEGQLYDLKQELYEKIANETELLKYPEGLVEEQITTLNTDYRSMASTYGYEDWDTFRNEYFQMDQAEFDEQVKLYAESLIKADMVIYAVAEKEGITLTEKAYEDELQKMLEMAGFASDDEFKSYSGMTIREYADSYHMDRDILLTKCLDAVYERIDKE